MLFCVFLLGLGDEGLLVVPFALFGLELVGGGDGELVVCAVEDAET